MKAPRRRVAQKKVVQRKSAQRKSALLVWPFVGLWVLTAGACHSIFGVKDPAEWAGDLKSGGYTALDVRTKRETLKNPAVGPVIHIPLGELEQRWRELDPSQTIYIFCEIGGRAWRAKTLLKKKGFRKVVNVGGWRDWNRAKGTVDP